MRFTPGTNPRWASLIIPTFFKSTLIMVSPIHFYSLLLPLATIQSHQTRCGGISKSKELLLEQDVSCSIDVVYPMHTTKQSTTEIHRKAVQHHKKGYVEDRRSLYEIRRFQMPMFRCGDHEDLMNGMFKTFSMTDLRDRSSYHKGIVAQSYSCHTKNMINKVSKHTLTIPVYSPLQELCFVRTAISSSPRMDRS